MKYLLKILCVYGYLIFNYNKIKKSILSKIDTHNIVKTRHSSLGLKSKIIIQYIRTCPSWIKEGVRFFIKKYKI